MSRQRLPLREFCQVRSGDKGDTSDISLFAPTEPLYQLLRQDLTAERVAAFLRPLAEGPVHRYEVPTVRALKFVVERALGGGAASSLRSDNLGKAVGATLLRYTVEVDEALLDAVPRLRHREG